VLQGVRQANKQCLRLPACLFSQSEAAACWFVSDLRKQANRGSTPQHKDLPDPPRLGLGPSRVLLLLLRPIPRLGDRAHKQTSKQGYSACLLIRVQTSTNKQACLFIEHPGVLYILSHVPGGIDLTFDLVSSASATHRCESRPVLEDSA
jgi:hypothetical protein